MNPISSLQTSLTDKELEELSNVTLDPTLEALKKSGIRQDQLKAPGFYLEQIHAKDPDFIIKYTNFTTGQMQLKEKYLGKNKSTIPLVYSVKPNMNWDQLFGLIDSYPIVNNKPQTLVLRDNVTDSYTWCLPTREMIIKLVKFISNRPVLSLGSGRGFVERLLIINGVVVNATDPAIGYCTKQSLADYHFVLPQFIDNKLAVHLFPNCPVLMIIWPPMSSMAVDSIRLFRGEHLIYIGEGKSGCNANDDFFNELEHKWTLLTVHKIPNWFAIYDSVFLFKRK